MAIRAPEELTIGLYERGAIRFATSDKPEDIGKPGGFIKLKSGRLSPTYFNIRGIPSFSKNSSMSYHDQEMLRELVISSYGEVIDAGDHDYDHLLGIPHAMTALGAMIGLSRRESVLSMRTESKAHGISKMIEGDYQPDESVLALDDAVTDGAAKFETVEKIIDAGLDISRFVVMVDREEGGAQRMVQSGLEIYSAMGMGAITAILAEQRLINGRQINWTAEYFHGLVEDKIIESIPSGIAAII
jgi:uridine monophosphate synthetase